MPTESKSTTNGHGHPLLSEHQALIEKYSNAPGPGAKAAIARKIVDAQVSMRIEGIAYQPWTKPTAHRTSYELSEAQLVTRIQALRQLVSDTSVEDDTRSSADRQLSKLVAQADRRGVEA